jgi:hypothetical protein
VGREGKAGEREGFGPVERANAHLISRVDQNLWVLVVGIFISAATDQVLGLLDKNWDFTKPSFLFVLQNAIVWVLAASALSVFTLRYIVLQNSFPALELNDRQLRVRKREETLATVRQRELNALSRSGLGRVIAGREARGGALGRPLAGVRLGAPGVFQAVIVAILTRLWVKTPCLVQGRVPSVVSMRLRSHP